MPDVETDAPPPDGQEAGGPTEATLANCVRAAIAAPSIHNSQPWLFRIGDGSIDVWADRRRRLEVIDPSGREMFISVGAAVFNLRLDMRRQGWLPMTKLFPEPAEPDLVARVAAGRLARPSDSLLALAAAIPRRHTNRRPFASAAIPASVFEELTAAARNEGAMLRAADAVGRNAILSLVRSAEQRLHDQGIYRAELAAWTRPEPTRRDGVPPQALGPWHALEALPLRDFGLTLPQLRRPVEPFEPYPTIVVISTEGDGVNQWVMSGQALQRVLLAATVRGLAATPMSQPLEIPALRELVTSPASGWWAQVILRLGYAPPTSPAPRRPVADVMFPAPP